VDRQDLEGQRVLEDLRDLIGPGFLYQL
jgi:hypothetical protein